MKQKDIALIIIIVAISAIASLLVSKALFVSPKNRQQKVEVVQPITADFPRPDRQFFNSQANDPTKLITIGQNSNSNPFSSTTSQ
jgi:hypothetical protein